MHSIFCFALQFKPSFAKVLLKEAKILQAIRAKPTSQELKNSIRNALTVNNSGIVCDVKEIAWPTIAENPYSHRSLGNSMLNTTLEQKQLYFSWHMKKLTEKFKEHLPDELVANVALYIKDELDKMPISEAYLFKILPKYKAIRQ